jgi:hypothetical protein
MSRVLAWVPDDTDSLRGASVDAGGLTGFGFACGACVLDFFAVLFSDGSDRFILKIDEFRY